MTTSATPATPVTRPAARRRQRSTRLLVAGGLVAVAAVAVVLGAVSGSWLVAVLTGALAVVLGAAGVRITWNEVTTTRREWARDRAEQAQAYRAITESRTAEQALFVADTSGRIARHEATIGRLESRLADAAGELAAARRELDALQDRALSAERSAADSEAERARLATRLEDAEDRAAQAIVRVAELEQELDVVLAEWRLGHAAPQRKHA